MVLHNSAGFTKGCVHAILNTEGSSQNPQSFPSLLTREVSFADNQCAYVCYCAEPIHEYNTMIQLCVANRKTKPVMRLTVESKPTEKNDEEKARGENMNKFLLDKENQRNVLLLGNVL